ncbi:MAG: non-homologous end-joining DNA ligase [Myxococcota bacterium]|nr:non-homologous end-joining DNA ligase [Myxococcota bacterium]
MNRKETAATAATLAQLAARYRDVQLATRVEELPREGRWTFELKFDGYRVLGLKVGRDVRLIDRHGEDRTAELAPLGDAVSRLTASELVLDGEVCALDARGKPSSRLLANRVRRGARLAYFVFDLLHLAGEDMRALPLETRRDRLANVVDVGQRQLGIVLSSAVQGDLDGVLTAAREAGLDGVIAKASGSAYTGGRVSSWLEIPCARRTALGGVRKAGAARPAAEDPARVEVAGISISHPARTLDPSGVTKLDLARYYEGVGRWMIAHVAGRPLTLLRWADGKATEKGGVYLRHARAWGPGRLRRVSIREKHKIGEYLVADEAEDLVALAQMDILEIHTWNAVAEDLERPNRVVFDLDPAPGVPWKKVVAAAFEVRERLARMHLDCWVKTTGGKGLHVVVPLVPAAGWDDCFRFTRRFAQTLALDSPKLYVSTMSKAARRGLIFVDYLRNTRANTSVAAYSTRAREGAPVSLPVSWEELARTDPAAAVMREVAVLLAGKRADPWHGYWRATQRLPTPVR